MDQVKTVLKALQKHIFWVVCGIVVTLSIVSWYLARGNLQKQYQANASNIDRDYTTVKSIRDKRNHPNEHSQKGMDTLNTWLLDSVLNAWQAQYSHQSKNKDMLWEPRLGADFVAAVEHLKPIESKVAFPTPLAQELKVDLRTRYANYVERLLPHLAETIGSKWVAKAVQPGMAPGAPDMPPEMIAGPTPGAGGVRRAEKPPIVVWNPADQGQLLTNHFDWSKQDGGRPTTLQLLYAQEDLWVLNSLMRIIKAANGEIDSRHEAAVKTIESILLGRQASGWAGQIRRLRPSAPGGEMPLGGSPGGEGYGPMTESMGSGREAMLPGGGPTPPGSGPLPPGGGPGMEGPPGTTRGPMDPADYRYVGNDYMPLRAEKVRSAMKSENPEDAFYVVAKRMPIRLRLVVDQRKLYRLLTEFGNCSLPVEIRQLRLNRKGSGSSGGTEYGGGQGYGMPAFGGEMAGSPGLGDFGGGPGPTAFGLEGGGTPGMPSGDMRARALVSSSSDYDVPVELQGIIYIYNPVDKSRLGLPEVNAAAGVPPVTNTGG